MPDGSTVSVKADLCWGLAERLFTREGEAPGSEGANAALLQESGPSAGGLEKLVLPDCVELSINKVDVDLKRELFGNIILSGGNTLWPGLPQRLGRVLGGRLPKRIKVKIHTPSTVRANPGPRAPGHRRLTRFAAAPRGAGGGAALQQLDRRLHTVVAGDLPPAVDQQGGVCRARRENRGAAVRLELL